MVLPGYLFRYLFIFLFFWLGFGPDVVFDSEHTRAEVRDTHTQTRTDTYTHWYWDARSCHNQSILLGEFY